MNITPRLLHTNQGYGEFESCPFCGDAPWFGVHLQDWENKAENVIKDCVGDDIPDDPSGFVLSVCCPRCTISMQECWCFNDFADKDKLLSSEYYQEKFSGLLWRWNRRTKNTFAENLAACAHNLVVNLDPNGVVNWPRVWKKRDRLKEAIELYNAKQK